MSGVLRTKIQRECDHSVIKSHDVAGNDLQIHGSVWIRGHFFASTKPV